MELSDNLNPHLSWTDAPEGTRSYALVVVDPDVPATAEHVNQEGQVINASLPRVDFYHWCMVNIPKDVTEIGQGSCSQGIVAGGKNNPHGPAGSMQGVNDYTNFMAGSDLAGRYHGYDGPCPPWNDEKIHHYHFKLFALDVDRLDLPVSFGGQDLIAAMNKHILAEASIVGTYTLFADHLAAQ